MTTLNAARQSVYSRFKTQWEAQAPPVPAFTFEDEKFTPPSAAPWVRTVVRNLLGTQRTLGPTGARRFARSALVLVDVFVPAGAGMKISDALATLVRGIFEGVSFEGLEFFAGTVQEIGVSDGWHQTQVECPFSYEETK
jgi:hypothetical protein